MKKNLSRSSLSFLTLVACPSLLSMEIKDDSEKNPLAESIFVTPVPTTRGLGFFRSTLDFVWDEEENLYADLLNKKFDPNNSSYHRKLDTAIEIFVTKNNNTRITEILGICREKYPKQIKIGDSPARMTHEFLVKENKTKQSDLASAIETKDKLFIDKQNILLDELQDSLSKQIAKISELLAAHLKERDTLVEQEGDDIRRIKKALVQLHHLNKTFVLPSDGYCSDAEEKDADNVKNSYNDEHLLKKIQVDFSMHQTKTKVERMLKTLYELNQAMQDIHQLRY